LLELRELIRDDIEIWTGGEGVRRLRKLPIGVIKFNSLENFSLPPATRRRWNLHSQTETPS
jgi:hypothetical protein